MSKKDCDSDMIVKDFVGLPIQLSRQSRDYSHEGRACIYKILQNETNMTYHVPVSLVL